MILDPSSDLRRLRDERSDWLLTVLTGVLILLIFVFAPLQAVGISAPFTCLPSACCSRSSGAWSSYPTVPLPLY